MTTQINAAADASAAIIWLDPVHALVAREHDGRADITEIERDVDAELGYLFRIAQAAAGCDRVVIMGPDPSRLAFEREYVALYQRPDRLVDVGPAPSPRREDLIDQLRFVDPRTSQRRHGGV